MSIEELVQRYIRAWNRQDVAGLLDLMHPGAAYYDAFWTETCVGRDLAQYFQDAMDEEPFWYEQVGDLIDTDGGVAFRYSAHNRLDGEISAPILYGAEVLIVQDNRILTITDFYCDPSRDALEAVAELARQRHSVPSHTTAGLGELKTSRVKAALATKIQQDRIYLDPDITISKLAENVGCSIEQLSIVLNKYFGRDFDDIVNTCRIEYARELLLVSRDDPNIVTQVARLAGFQSSREFDKKFEATYGISAREYCRFHNQGGERTDHVH